MKPSRNEQQLTMISNYPFCFEILINRNLQRWRTCDKFNEKLPTKRPRQQLITLMRHPTEKHPASSLKLLLIKLYGINWNECLLPLLLILYDYYNLLIISLIAYVDSWNKAICIEVRFSEALLILSLETENGKVSFVEKVSWFYSRQHAQLYVSIWMRESQKAFHTRIMIFITQNSFSFPCLNGKIFPAGFLRQKSLGCVFGYNFCLTSNDVQ